jgi:hypothetical protein
MRPQDCEDIRRNETRGQKRVDGQLSRRSSDLRALELSGHESRTKYVSVTMLMPLRKSPVYLKLIAGGRWP